MKKKLYKDDAALIVEETDDSAGKFMKDVHLYCDSALVFFGVLTE